MKICKSCKAEIPSDAKKCSHCGTDQRNWFMRHKIITGVLVLVVLVSILTIAGGNSGNTGSVAPKKASGSSQSSTAQPTGTPSMRVVEGKLTTLGAGTFTGGKDVPTGLYNVTAAAGESGNFIVNGTDSYNEVLGQADSMGVPKVRVQISDGDQIQISGLSAVTFTPVTAQFVTSYAPATLYAGTFVVGQDIGAGRYVATPATGESGNFIIAGNDSVNEILGQNDNTGVPNVTVNLTDGDIITISGISQVTLTPTK